MISFACSCSASSIDFKVVDLFKNLSSITSSLATSSTSCKSSITCALICSTFCNFSLRCLSSNSVNCSFSGLTASSIFVTSALHLSSKTVIGSVSFFLVSIRNRLIPFLTLRNSAIVLRHSVACTSVKVSPSYFLSLVSSSFSISSKLNSTSAGCNLTASTCNSLLTGLLPPFILCSFMQVLYSHSLAFSFCDNQSTRFQNSSISFKICSIKS